MEKSEAEGQNNEETKSTRSRRSSKSSGRLTVRSSAACSSRSSASTRASMAAARAQAEAQAAKARLAYAEKEMNIKVEKARLEATLDVINLQKEADAALAKAEVMESAAAQFDKAESGEEWPLSPLQVTPEQKVSEYINKHSHTDLAPDITSYHDDSKYQNEQSKQPVMYTPLCPKQEPVQYSFMPQDGAERRLQRDVSPQTLHDALQLQHRLSSNNNADPIARLSKFDDKPENYLSWKATFQSTVRDLGLKATEEINLLIKWLGPESSEHAKRLKAVNIKHPPAGLNMIWLRLEECYGSPEAIENSLKEPHKLRDLSDLLCELQAAKLDGYLPGLSYLDTARGVHPIVEKLPFHLQEKWTMVGSKFKEDHNVSFPPFAFFVEFVKRQAKARNDPSFTTPFNTTLSYVNHMSSYRKEKPLSNHNQRSSVTVHKMDISSEGSKAKKADKDIERQCPIHHKPHPLKRCRGFRAMLLEQRKRFLRDYSICYRCLASTGHQAKDCTVIIKCEESNSEKHLAALHPAPTLQMPKPPSSPEVHGGEQANPQDPDVTATCTEVCGNEITGRSCSKVCLVQGYPKGQRDNARRMYAIIDDQSNQSLAKTEFFDIFNIQPTPEPYMLKTCSGVTHTTGRRACGYMVESLDGKISFPLPTLIECNAIPNNREECRHSVADRTQPSESSQSEGANQWQR
ncbi:acetylcholinesterase [Sarotherodon galilaeus]